MSTTPLIKSYLSWPRLHFAGRFQADTSTVNNDVRHYDNARFRPSFQQLMESQNATWKLNGYWNPEGSAAFRLIDCHVTGAATAPNTLITDPSDDPIIGAQIGGSTDRVAGKLVDLDPQQQGCSEIWGLKVQLLSDGKTAMDSRFEVSPLYQLWKRQQVMESFDQTLAAAFQSTLSGVEWPDVIDSAALKALKDASADGMLSIRFNVFGYNRSPQAEDYTTGFVVGTIGPASEYGPKRFTLGRQLVPPMDNAVVAQNGLGYAQALVDNDSQMMAIDLGNSLPIVHSHGDLADMEQLFVAVLDCTESQHGAILQSNQLKILAPVPYLAENWYHQTAGVVDVPLGEHAAQVADHPIGVVQEQPDGSFKLLLRETMGGQYARADLFVHRLNPGQSARIDVYSSVYGVPTVLPLSMAIYNDMIGGAGTNAKISPPIAVPDVGQPADVFTTGFPASDGTPGLQSFTLTLSEKGPGNPRGYIDGQVYGIQLALSAPPANYIQNPWNFVSILAFDDYQVPETPTWYQDIQPIMTQYGNLYPIMSKHLVDLGDYDSVVKHLKIMTLSFALPASDPNSMPVSRDLSAKKLSAIMKWLGNMDPATGKPYLGTPPATPEPAPEQGPDQDDIHEEACPEIIEGKIDAGGKMDFIKQVLQQRRNGKEN